MTGIIHVIRRKLIPEQRKAVLDPAHEVLTLSCAVSGKYRISGNAPPFPFIYRRLEQIYRKLKEGPI